MRKTPFIGLTVLDSGESLFTDNAAFTTRDREEIDRALKIGVRTHRHTGAQGLSDPDQAASASIIPSAGTIDAGITLTIGYTLEDANGGETLISPLTVVSTPSPLDVPLVAPVAELDNSAGELMVDTYAYSITYLDGEGGETPTGPSVVVSRDPGPANAQIKLSGLTNGMEAAGATHWRLYRATGGASLVFLAEGDTSEDEFIDDGLTSPICDLHPPTENINTTNQVNTLEVLLPSGGVVEDAAFINLYATQGAGFEESSLLAQYPVASAGANPTFTALEFLDSQPPDVNRSYDSPEQIDPDTELLDWHWKRPVLASANLGSGLTGDVKLVEGTGDLYGVLLPLASAANPQEWTKLASGGAGSAAAVSQLIASAASGNPGSVSPTEKLTFVPSGRTKLGLSNPVPGEAKLSIFSPSLTASAASGNPGRVLDVDVLQFVGSGGASASVEELSPGIAQVTVSASGAAGPTGKTGEKGADGKDASLIEHRSFTDGPNGTGNLEWSHNGGFGDETGLLVFVVANDSTPSDEVTEVTVEFEAGEELALSPLLHTAGTEDGVIYAYFLRGTQPFTGIGTTPNIKVTVAGATSKKAVSIGVRAGENVSVIDTTTLDTAALKSTGLIAGGGAYRRPVIAYAAMHSGANSVSSVTATSGSEKLGDHDFGTQTAHFFRSPNANYTGANIVNISDASESPAGILAVAISPEKDFGLVSELPTTAGKGDRCLYQAAGEMTEQGVIWELVYNGTNWTKIGGPPLWARETTQRNTASETYQTTGAPAVTAPLKGKYLTRWGTGLTAVNASTGALMAVHVNGVLTSGNSQAGGGASTDVGPTTGFDEITVGTAGHVVQVRYRRLSGSGEAQFHRMYLEVDPVYVE